MKSFLVVGGDLRYIRLAEFLSKSLPGNNTNSVTAMGFDKSVCSDGHVSLHNAVQLCEERFNYLILPIPAAKDDSHVNIKYSVGDIPMTSLPPLVKEGGIVFAGRMSEMHKALFEDAGLTVIDYSSREDFAVMNAAATAEGAIEVAMTETDCTISSQKILILGMGRIAKTLIKQLSGFTSDITASARKASDIAWAGILTGNAANGISLNECFERLGEFDLIFNTIPKLILTEERLKLCNRNVLIIDLASKPGGVDFEAAHRLGIKTIHALSVPGKVAPVTAGRVIAQTIRNILSERGEHYE